MKDLRGDKLEIPKFKINVSQSFWEVMSSVGLAGGKIVPGEYEKCIMLILDGFGYRLMDSFGMLGGLGMEAHEIGSVIPTMTATCMASIFSGTMPAEHGILGARFWLPEAEAWVKPLTRTTADGRPLDMKRELILTNRLWDVMADKGIGIRAIKPEQVGKTFSQMLFPDEAIELVPGAGGIGKSLKNFLASEDSIALPYWPNPDLWLHHGKPIEEIRSDLWGVLNEVSRLRNEQNADKTCLVVMSDHGMVRLEKTVDLRELNPLWEGIPHGKSRQRMASSSKPEEVAEKLEGVHVIDGRKLLDSGIMGRAHEKSYGRMSQLMLLAKGNVLMSYDGPDHVYAHGSLSADEMSATFAFCRLSDFAPQNR